MRGDLSPGQEQIALVKGLRARGSCLARAKTKLLWWSRAVELFGNRATAQARARQLGLNSKHTEADWARACVRQTANGKPIIQKMKQARKKPGQEITVRPWPRKRPLVPHVDWEAGSNGSDAFDWMAAGGRTLRRSPGVVSGSKLGAVQKKILKEDRQLREQSYLRCVRRQGAREIGWFRSPPAEGFRVRKGYALEPVSQKVKDAWLEFHKTWEASINVIPLGEAWLQTTVTTATEQKEETNDADQITERRMGDHDGSCHPVPSEPRQLETVA